MNSTSYNPITLYGFRRSDGVLISAKLTDSGQLRSINPENAVIDDGRAFMVSRYFPAIANNNNAEIVLIPDRTMHIIMAVAASAEILLRFFAGTTFNADGNLLTPRNRNNNSSIVSTALFREGATITGDGVETSAVLVPGGGVFGSGGESGLLGTKLILKAGDSYMLRLENTSGGAIRSTFQILFFEEDLTTL